MGKGVDKIMRLGVFIHICQIDKLAKADVFFFLPPSHSTGYVLATGRNC